MTQQIVQTSAKRGGTLNSAHRLTIRVALATGAMVATLVGAQTFANFDRPSTPTSSGSSDSTAANTTQPSLAVTAAKIIALAPAPPHLVIVRGAVDSAGSSNINPATSQNAIVPPAAIAIQAPAALAVVPQSPGGSGGGSQPAPAQPQPKPPTKTS